MVRSLSRPRSSRNSSFEGSFRYPDTPENLVLPSGQISEETVELLHEFVHPHQHHAEETLVEEDDAEDLRNLAEERRKLPWYKRPSPWW